MDNILDFIRNLLPSTTYTYDYRKSKGQEATPSPSPSPSPQSSDTELAQKILAGYRKYSGGKQIDIEKYIPLMVQAAKKYPIFQKNPYLIPATSVVETSGGQNFKLNNNPLSWAARLQQAGQYNPSSNEQSMQDMVSAVGGDPNRGAGYDPQTAQSRMQTAGYYDKFRNSNNLQDFTNTYDGGNSKYLPALMAALRNFQQ